MANRLAHKPDPAIKKNVRRARVGAQAAKRAQTIMVTASLAVTMMGWALFSHQEAQTAANAQLTASSPVAAVQQAESNSPTPAATTITEASR